jgi:cellulose synthase/poly-beta-1,6-N-acetylglucosamine synthase-like glycosyltransferase
LDVFGVVTVVPGAIGAWRTAAVRQAGGYPPNTVAEDADLTLTLLERGYRVHYEDRALAYTEAPHSARGLMRQRSRWSFGILQAMWKHRGAFKHKGVLGWMAMPNIVIFHYLLPLLAPLLDVVFLLGVADYFLTRQAQMEGYSNSLIKLLGPFFVFFFVDFLASAFAMALERPGADRWKNLRLLGHVWLQRFVYRQLFSLVMLLTVKRVIEGYEFHWGKLERTAALQCHLEQEVAPSPIMDEDPASAA